MRIICYVDNEFLAYISTIIWRRSWQAFLAEEIDDEVPSTYHTLLMLCTVIHIRSVLNPYWHTLRVHPVCPPRPYPPPGAPWSIPRHDKGRVSMGYRWGRVVWGRCSRGLSRPGNTWSMHAWWYYNIIIFVLKHDAVDKGIIDNTGCSMHTHLRLFYRIVVTWLW